MRTLEVRCWQAAVLGLLVFGAAAPAAQAQTQRAAQPRYQFELSLDHVGSRSMHSVIAESPGGSYQASQEEAVNFSVTASRLVRIAPRTSLRFGLSIADKGITERGGASTEAFERHVDIVYLGAPLTVGYNLVSARRGVVPFVEVGVVPELLVREEESEFPFDLRSTGLSYLASVGVKYNLGDGRALVLAPEVRTAAREYSRETPGTYEYRPIVVGLKLGVQF